jgi:protein TonB
VVEQQAEFPGNLIQYLQEKLSYPQIARDSNIQGRVVVRFVINEKGEVVSPRIVRTVHAALDEEALRVVRTMPRWKPGKQNGKAVATYYSLPISFKLQ